MVDDDFVSTLEVLLRKILISQGVRPNKRNLYNPLRHTEFRHRKARWFPQSRFGAPPMPEEDFHIVRKRLLEARDAIGAQALKQDDFNQLDLAWALYKAEKDKGLTVSERIPKHFETLLRGVNDFKSVEELMAFVYDKTYRLMLRGEHRECAKALHSIYAAFENGHLAFGRSRATRKLQRELLLINGNFCLHSFKDEGRQMYASAMRRLFKAEPSPLLQGGILTHEYMENPTTGVLRDHVELFKGRGLPTLGNQFYRGIELIRAAGTAMRSGLLMHEKPFFLDGYSIEEAFDVALGMFPRDEHKIEYSMCKAVQLAGVGASGDLDGAIDGILSIRQEQTLLADRSPPLEALLLVAEARSFYAASRGTAKDYLYVAGTKVRELQAITDHHLRPGDIEFIRTLRRVSIEKLGTDVHMGSCSVAAGGACI